MSTVFVTATGTEVGKTVVARGLIKELRAQGRPVEALKPVVSGYDPHEAAGSDPGLLLTALGVGLISLLLFVSLRARARARLNG